MIKEIVNQYKNGEISKNEYGHNMFKVHEILLEYVTLLNGSLVEDITINKDSVVVSIKSKDNIVKMKLYDTDEGSIAASVLNNGEYESEELNMSLKVLSYLEENSVVLDVGANLGWYTINILLDKRDRKIYSFEPIKKTYEILKENLKLNNIDSKYVFNIGLFNQNKVEEFYFDITGSGASSIANLRNLETTKKVNCNLMRLDDFVKENNIERIDFIKCDVEGSELFVYEGGIKSITKFKPVVFSEMLRKWSAKFGYHPNDIIDLFTNIGYGCYIIKNQNIVEFSKVDEETVEKNYFFLHKEKHKDIISLLKIDNY